MKKQNIIIFGVILAILVIVWVVFIVKRDSKAPVSQLNIIQQENINLQPQSIPVDQLVWYEIPELGIKFKVAPDAKEDLKYSIIKEQLDKQELITAILYLQSIKEFLLQNRRKLSDDSFAQFYDYKITRSLNGYCENKKKESVLQNCDVILKNNDVEFNLYINKQSTPFGSEEEGKKYALSIKEKNLGFFQYYGDIDLLRKAYDPFHNVEFINK